MVSIPAAMPLATPEPEMLAIPLVDPHIPPVTDSVYVVVIPVQMDEEPVIAPAVGAGLTLTVVVA